MANATWPGATEHASLYTDAIALAKELRSITERLRSGDVHYVVHSDMAARCRSLASYLESALADAERDTYAPALGTLRSALEHVFIDKLVFLGRRYVEVFRIDPVTWAKWERAWKAGEVWTDVTHWPRIKKGEVCVTREGIHSQPDKDGKRQTIGVHFFLLSQYSPFVGPPSEQQHFDDGLSELDEREEEARQHREMYQTYLKWQSVKESLKANDFADDGTLRKLDVHYRFLSAFVHPNTATERLLYGKNTWDWPQYDHYASELILLYAIVLAIEELRNFRAMTLREPTVEIDNWESTEQLCNNAWQHSNHLWFPGQEPHDYDRFRETNRRDWRQQPKRSRGRQSARSADATRTANEIGYYVNPLERLIALHRNNGEFTTGRVYRSPWPRPDARFRLL